MGGCCNKDQAPPKVGLGSVPARAPKSVGKGVAEIDEAPAAAGGGAGGGGGRWPERRLSVDGDSRNASGSPLSPVSNGFEDSVKCTKPTLLGGEVDDKGLYKIPESRRSLCLAGEQRLAFPTFSNVHIVKKLDISRNKIKVVKSECLKSWESLSALTLSNNLLPDIPGALRSLPCLTSLDMSSNPIKHASEGAPTEACGVIPHLKHLKQLSLRDCKLAVIPKGICLSETLETIDLSSNPGLSFTRNDKVGLHSSPNLTAVTLSDSRMARVPAILSSIPKLRKLDLSSNTGVHGPDYLDALLHMPELRNLSLDNCRLTTVPPAVIKLRSLDTLSLSANPLGDLKNLEKLPHLKSIRLWRCDLKTIPDGLLKSKSLTSVELVSNGIDSQALKALAGSPLSQNIECLNLMANPLSYNLSYRTFDVIGGLKSLRVFWFERWGDKQNAPGEKSVIYSCRVPAQLLALPLRTLNGVDKEDLFTGDLATTMKQVLLDGTLRVDFGVAWEEEMHLYVNMCRIFDHCKLFILKDPTITLERYKLYLSWTMPRSSNATFASVTGSGEETIIPPVDVLFFLYLHILNPEAYLADTEANGLRFVHHLPYPFLLEQAAQAFLSCADDIQESPFQASASRWNQKLPVKGLNDPRFRYEWFLKPECTAAETPEGRCLPARGAGGGEAELPQYAFGLDHLAELDGALDFVHEVVEHADDLLRNWSVGRDRYLKYFCLHLLDPDAPLVPSMGIQTAAHVHMCAPSQYRHAMQYYCKGKYLPFEAPAALSKSGMTATQVTTQAWLRHFDEEYLSFQMDASALNVVARSPRQYSPERPGSNDAKRRRSLLKQAGSVPAIDAKVRFKTGATNSSFVVTKRGSDSNSGTPPPAPLSVASRGEASDRNETSSQAGSAVKDDDKPPTEPGGTPLETTQPAGKIRPSHFTQSADEAGPVQSAQPAVKFRPSSFAKSVDNIAPAESTPPAVKFRPSSFAKSVDNIGPSDCAQAADGMQPVDSTPPAVKFRPSSFAKSVDNIGPSESTQAAVKYRPSSFAKSVDDIGSSESAQPARKPDPLNTTQPADSIHPLDATQSERKPDPLNTTQPADSIQPLDFAQSAENGVADLSLFEPVGDEASPTALGRGAKDPCENSDNMITQSAFFVAEGNGDLPRGDTA